MAYHEDLLWLSLELEGVYSIEDAYKRSLVVYFEKSRP